MVAWKIIFVLATLICALQLQRVKSLPVGATESGKAKEGDEFAKQAADALDSTLFYLKGGLDNLIKDSAKISDVFDSLTNSFQKLVPQNDDSSIGLEESQARLNKLKERNITLI